MPNPKINQQIEEQLFRMDRTAKALGLGPLDPAQLKRAHERIYTGVVQAMAQLPAGQQLLGQAQQPTPGQPQQPNVPVTNSQGEPQPILMPRPKITMRAA